MIVLVAAVLLTAASCGGSSNEAAPSSSTPPSSTGAGEDPVDPESSVPLDEPEPLGEISGPTSEMVLVNDPVNNAFSVDVPVGWDNLVYSTVEGQVYRGVVNSMSPDGETVLFLSDPKLPNYWNPDTADEMTRLFAENLDSMELAYYVPAPDYFSDYIQTKFGHLDDFAILGTEENVQLEQLMFDSFANAGMSLAGGDAVDISFTFTDDDGRTSNAVITGMTMNSGPIWQADVWGIATTGSPDDYADMLWTMANSKKTNPEFAAWQEQQHQQTMAEIQANTEAMTRRHEANMAQIQASANAHQQRMQAIWAANDANVAGFYDRMNSSDVSHRGFLNYINEEKTVQVSGGTTMQVDNSYDRYWVNKNDNSYVGGGIDFDDSSLIGMGLNPSDYEEARIVR